jgi:hypothetical protein
MVVTMTGGTTALGILMRAQIELATSDADGVDVDDGRELFIAAWCVHPGLILEQHRAVKLRVSLYADDAALFLNPIRQEIQGAMWILAAFAQASGLVTNFAKCAIYPVVCTALQIEGLLDVIPCEVKDFPFKYLGLPLHTRALRKIDVQPLINRIASKLPSWKAKFLDRSRRLTLVHSVLTSMPVHFMTVFALKKWAIKKIDNIRRSFL